jgi:hypothetical protein
MRVAIVTESFLPPDGMDAGEPTTHHGAVRADAPDRRAA